MKRSASSCNSLLPQHHYAVYRDTEEGFKADRRRCVPLKRFPDLAKGADPSIASLIMSLEAPISAVAGFVIVQQALSLWELLGCVLMSVAIVLAQLPER